MRDEDEEKMIVQRFELKEGEPQDGVQYKRKTIEIDKILKDGSRSKEYSMSHVPQMSQYNIKKRVNGKPTEFYSSLLQIDSQN